MAVSTASLILAWFCGGVGCGLASTACPLYIFEVSPENNRGRMVTLYHFSVCFGIVICVFVNWGIFSFAKAYALTETLSPYWRWFAVDQNWREMFVSEAIPGFLFLMSVLLLPESPRWLVKNARIKEAESILEKINGKDKARNICAEIREKVFIETRIRFFDLFTSKLRKPLLLSIFICIFSEACGSSAVLYYGPQLFEQAGFILGHSLDGISVMMLVNLGFNLVAMTAFVAFFACSIGPVKFVILSEIFPNRICGKAISVGTVCIWLTSAAIAQLFPMMREVVNIGNIFFFLALDIAVLLMVVRILLPETKGRSIEEIERSWFVSK